MLEEMITLKSGIILSILILLIFLAGLAIGYYTARKNQ